MSPLRLFGKVQYISVISFGVLLSLSLCILKGCYLGYAWLVWISGCVRTFSVRLVCELFDVK